MFRLYIALFLGFLLCSCSNSGKSRGEIRVSVLRGPSAIAFAEWMEHSPELNGKPLRLEIKDSPDQIVAAMVKKETDIAVLPMISAANLYNKGVQYVLAGCPIWGTLYMVGKEPFSTLHLFGRGTTPDILARYYLDRQQKHCEIFYTFGTVAEMTQGFLSQRIEAAVLSEPFVGVVMQRDPSLRILADLNNPAGDSIGFAQTAIVFHPSLLSERTALDSLIRKSCEFAVEHPDQVIRILEEKELFAKGMLTKEGIKRAKIQYRSALETGKEIRSFLEIIEQYEPEAIGGRLPARGFITGEP